MHHIDPDQPASSSSFLCVGYKAKNSPYIFFTTRKSWLKSSCRHGPESSAKNYDKITNGWNVSKKNHLTFTQSLNSIPKLFKLGWATQILAIFVFQQTTFLTWNCLTLSMKIVEFWANKKRWWIFKSIYAAGVFKEISTLENCNQQLLCCDVF